MELKPSNDGPPKATQSDSKGSVSRKKSKVASFDMIEAYRKDHPPTSYLETLMHLLKGNVGTGCFGMADAMKNGGIILGPILTLIIAVICTHTQHMLTTCAEIIQTQNELKERPDYAETIFLSFLVSKSTKLQKMAGFMRVTCNIFICLTQLGFCCVYVVFVAKNVKDVLDYHKMVIDLKILMLIVLVPIWMTTMIRKLKFIAIFSSIANVCMVVGVILTVGYASIGLPNFSDRHYFGKLGTLPLFFGTTLFAFEGIALVLPLKNAMKNPSDFTKTWGVLNVGMIIVTILYNVVGVIGYWKYGEKVQGSLTLNLPTEAVLSQVIKLIIALGILLGYAIQFFIPIQIMFEPLTEKWRLVERYPMASELLMRTILVVVTLLVAELVPRISLLLSLVGSVCCTVLAFVFPVISELILRKDMGNIGFWNWTKNGIILLIALAGFVFGGALSIIDIAKEVTGKTN